MKKLFLSFLLCFILAFVGVTYNNRIHVNDPLIANHAAAHEAATSHLLGLKADGENYGWCTGTVIAPHAILTAEHCAEKDLTAITVDYGLSDYNVEKIVKDHNEHVILLVDGPAFTQIEEYKAREPRVGEHEYFYGFGGKEYPAKLKSGVVLDEYDPSEVNKNDGLIYCSAPSIPGDSGAAVYGDDGSILTLVTFHTGEERLLSNKFIMGGYALRFTPEQIEKAKNYSQHN